MRLQDAAVKRRDSISIDIRNFPLAIREDFNPRFDFGTDEETETNVASVRRRGIMKALIGSKNERDEFVVSDGHRRSRWIHLARQQITSELEASDLTPERRQELLEEMDRVCTVPVEAEPKTITDKERLFDMAIHNAGKPFNVLETAYYCQRLREAGADDEEIVSRKTLSITALKNCDILLSAPELHCYIRDGKVMPSPIIELIRKVSDAKARVDFVETAIAVADAKNKDHATARDFPAAVSQQIQPSKARAKAKGKDEGEDGKGKDTQGKDGNNNGNADDTLIFNEALLTDHRSIPLSTYFSPETGIDGTITTACHRQNGTWFYKVSLDCYSGYAGPWRFALPVDPSKPPVVSYLGFDEKQTAIAGAWKEIVWWLLNFKAPADVVAIGRAHADIDSNEEDDDENEDEDDDGLNPPEPEDTTASVAPDTTSPSSGTAPSTDEKTIAADAGNAYPVNAMDAFDHMDRLVAELSQVGGIRKRNERFVTIEWLLDYKAGKKTHNEFKAFFLYGSPETRGLHAQDAA